MTQPTALPSMPFPQPDPLALPPAVRELQARHPVTRIRTLTGDQAWYVTGYAEVKQLLNDARLGRSHPDPEHAPRISDSALFGGPLQAYATEREDHARMRALLTPFFSARRMEALRPRVETLVDELLEAMARAGPPLDLHQALSFPLPVLVICELLGVPGQDRERFRSWSRDMADLHDRQRAQTAITGLVGYMRELVARKRRCPGDDVISGLCAAEGGSLSDDRIAFLAAMLLFAGHETTVVRIDLGTLLLLTNPDQHRALLRDPSLVATAVEEILRASVTGGGGLPRYPREEVEIGGVSMGAGEAVLLDIGAGNHDPRAFDSPDRFQVGRHPNPHLAFGHGPRFCIGAPLARLELRAVFERLVPRFPTLRLAVPVERLRVRSDVLTGGLHELPVTW
ncbi:MAG TPA: cytochrome P450 [Candidatus Dormibacteraeota bacterium]|jgi:cytochrome P450|nr:cytochrome P450 [Candidatus Dormibacteraeota bacterium]